MIARIVLSASAALLALAPAARAQGELPETLKVPAAGTVSGTAVYKAGVAYTIEISGRITLAVPGSSPPSSRELDAFWCFAGQPAGEGVCTKPREEPPIGVEMSGDAAHTRRQLPNVLEPRNVSPAYRGDHAYAATFVPHDDGRVTLNTKDYCGQAAASCSGPGFTVTISEKCGGPARARAAAINEVRVLAVQPEVDVHRAGTPEDRWCKVERDTVLKQGDEISVDPDGAVSLQFADNSTVVVTTTTQFKIASFFTEGGVVRTEILLKMGQIAAQVCKACATKSDFRIKAPTGTNSVRGTTFSVFYDPLARSMLTTVEEGSVEVDPSGSGLKTVTLAAGREVDVGARSVSRVAKAGRAGARGGLNRVAALARVMKAVRAANGPCAVTVPRDRAFAVTPAKGGWKVRVQIEGRLKGASRWSVLRGRARPVNALAKKLARSCR